MILQLKDKCLKIDKPNAKAIVDGYRKNGILNQQSIWLAVRDFNSPALLTMQRSNTPYKVSKLGEELNLDGFRLPLKYAASLTAEYFVKNDMQLWETLCSNGLFDIWNPSEPYQRFAQSKSNPEKFRIQLLRIFEIEKEFDHTDIKFTSARIDTLISREKTVKVKAPLIADTVFADLQDILEHSIRNYLISDPHYYIPKAKKLPSSSVIEAAADLIEEQIRNDPNMPETEKETVIKARIGQGRFREDVLSLHKSCPFTGISNPILLKAGHIKPWAKCETNEERLDPLNGIALSPAADHLFDKGYLSFSDQGNALFSPLISIEDLHNLGFLKHEAGYNIVILNRKQLTYIRFHRHLVFKTA